MEFDLSVRRIDAVTIIDMAGRLTLGEPTFMLREAVRSEGEKSKKLLLNLEGVSYIDSAGLGELAGCLATMAGRGGAIKLVHVQKRLTELMQITRLCTLFEIHDNEPAALASYGVSGAASA
ncbi:MAG: STAS domain-containing protein [Acidobacteria bacterium]|nr:STAS domain-containing protein [Acidobacteriota bacterium]